MSDNGMRQQFEDWMRETYYSDDDRRAMYRNSSVEKISYAAWQAALSTSPLLDKSDQAETGARVHIVCDDSDGLIAMSSGVAGQLLCIKEALEKGDVDEALFALVHLSDPNLSAVNPWAKLEEIAKSPQPPQTDSNGLVEAAKAVVARWDTPVWEEAEHTGVFINRLRAALAQSPSVGLNTKKGG